MILLLHLPLGLSLVKVYDVSIKGKMLHKCVPLRLRITILYISLAVFHCNIIRTNGFDVTIAMKSWKDFQLEIE